ncbi:MAG: SAM-dependent methyltransferase [Myxococcales bacterium]|nr:SAM-dependent methyltransferase [Myxococcales bacterium]
MNNPRMLDFPATRRNRETIFAVLSSHLPAAGTLLEIASGSGQHAVAISARLPQWQWLPSDAQPAHVQSINAWREQLGPSNCAEALLLDVHDQPWPVSELDAIFCANMIHVAPWSAAKALLSGAAAALRPQGQLFVYGPFIQAAVPTAPSNLAFNADLQVQDPTWGIRDLDEIEREAQQVGLQLQEVTAMPANNLTVIFRRL